MLSLITISFVFLVFLAFHPLKGQLAYLYGVSFKKLAVMSKVSMTGLETIFDSGCLTLFLCHTSCVWLKCSLL